MKNSTLLIFILTCNLAFAQTDWIQKTDFGGTARFSAIGASIGTNGYIGMGKDNNGRQNDLWEWNQSTNAWTQKANFPALGREGAIGFAIGNKLYVGTGYDGNTYKNDLYEFDPITNTWIQKANIPVGRAEGVGFSIGTKGYMLTGSTNSNFNGSNDLWEYDQTNNIWTQKANVPTTGTFLASGFSIGTKGYLLVNQTNFWEYDPATDTWSQKANIGASSNIDRAADFSANGKGYLAGIGQNGDELWEYTPTTDTWIHLENIPNGERGIATGFSIGSLLYVGTGYESPYYKKDYWEGNPSNLSVGVNSISEHNSKKSICSIFPNPTNESINIKVLSNIIGTSYLIIDQLGKEIFVGKLTNETTTLDISFLSSGLYFIKLKGRNDFAFKISKQ